MKISNAKIVSWFSFGLTILYFGYIIVCTCIYCCNLYFPTEGGGGIVHGIFAGLFFGLWRSIVLMCGLSFIWPSAFEGLLLNNWWIGGIAMGIMLLACLLIIMQHKGTKFMADVDEDDIVVLQIFRWTRLFAPIVSIISVMLYFTCGFLVHSWGLPIIGSVIGILYAVVRLIFMVFGAGFYFPDLFHGFGEVLPIALNIYFYALIVFFFIFIGNSEASMDE